MSVWCCKIEPMLPSNEPKCVPFHFVQQKRECRERYLYGWCVGSVALCLTAFIRSVCLSFCCSLTILEAFLHPAEQHSLRTFSTSPAHSLLTSASTTPSSPSSSPSNKWPCRVGKNSVEDRRKATRSLRCLKKASQVAASTAATMMLNGEYKVPIRRASNDECAFYLNLRIAFYADCLKVGKNSFSYFWFVSQVELWLRERQSVSWWARSTSWTAVSSLQSIMIGDVHHTQAVSKLVETLSASNFRAHKLSINWIVVIWVILFKVK